MVMLPWRSLKEKSIGDMFTIEELREILKLPIDDFKIDSLNSFELKLIFRNNDVGRIFNPMIKSISRDTIIDTSRIKWGAIFEHYKLEIESHAHGC